MPFIAGAMIVGAGASYFGGQSAAKSSEKLQKMQLYLQYKQLKFAKQQWQHYRDTYGDLEKVMVADAMQGVQGDFSGVASRAREDVLSAGENQQEQQRRQLQSMGIDPSSGRYVSSDRRTGIQMATGSALASNKARADERRYADQATRGIRMSTGQFGASMMRGAGQDVMAAQQRMGQAYGDHAAIHGELAGNLFAQAGQMGMYGMMQGADSGLWGKAVEGVKGFFSSDQPSMTGIDVQGSMNSALQQQYNPGFDTTLKLPNSYGGISYAGTGY